MYELLIAEPRYSRTGLILTIASEQWRVRFESKQNSACRFHDAWMDANVLRYCVHIPECPLQRTTRVERVRASADIEKINGLDGA